MYKLDNRLVQDDGKTLGEIAIYFIFSIIIGFVVASTPFLFLDPEKILHIKDFPELRMSYLIAQGFSNFLLFGGTVFILLFLFLRKNTSYFNRQGQHLKGIDFLIPFIIYFAGYNFLEYLIEWNQNIEFPPEIATWAKELEDKAEEATKFMLNFSSWYEMVIGVLIIGVLVAIAEEFFFRGIIQNYLFALTKNIHIAIFITGVLFSAIHFQFYGFLPRLVLSVLISYIYFISGNIWMAILLHSLNNSLTVIGSYFIDSSSLESYTPDFQTALFSLFFIVGVLLLYYRQHSSFFSPKVEDE